YIYWKIALAVLVSDVLKGCLKQLFPKQTNDPFFERTLELIAAISFPLVWLRDNKNLWELYT
ncbi:MAG: hypothetical protein KAI61_02085, partial [Alphaproteobacteria bacterium]|nr:hypothetical protein [Alphaproteobacteria bacterium]MCK5555959.1 hypothetical protein [Alphaproteobacteria bacterium]